MRVELGERVRASDGVDVGHIKYLILDPASTRVSAVVVEKGLLWTEDVEVTIDMLVAGPENDTRLKYPADEVKGLPRFDRNRYSEPGEDVARTYGYPNVGLLWPVGTPYPSLVPGQAIFPGVVVKGGVAPLDPLAEDLAGVEALDEPPAAQPPPTIITEGSEVRTREGDRVGEVHRVVFDATSGRPISLVIRRGALFTEDVEMPGEKIASVVNGIVYLDMSAEEFKEWTSAPSVPFV